VYQTIYDSTKAYKHHPTYHFYIYCTVPLTHNLQFSAQSVVPTKEMNHN
jgi:hypothetical protein